MKTSRDNKLNLNTVSKALVLTVADSLATSLDHYFSSVGKTFSVAEKRVKYSVAAYLKEANIVNEKYSAYDPAQFDELYIHAEKLLLGMSIDVILHNNPADIFNNIKEHNSLFRSLVLFQDEHEKELYILSGIDDGNVIDYEDKCEAYAAIINIFKGLESGVSWLGRIMGDEVIYYTRLKRDETVTRLLNSSTFSHKKETLFGIIEKCAKSIKNGRDSHSIMHCISAETGELSEEVRKIYSPDFYKKPGKDGILGEGCDVIIGVVDLLVANGYTEEQVMDTIKDKTTKWSNVTDKVKKVD